MVEDYASDKSDCLREEPKACYLGTVQGKRPVIAVLKGRWHRFRGYGSLLLSVGVFSSHSGLVQRAPRPATDRAAVVDFARTAVLRALNYDQGDRQSLMDAQADFTAEGWREFMKRMDVFLDAKGAPEGSSSFVPTGNVVVKDQDNGVMHLRVDGTLKQSQNKSSTTYQVQVDIEIRLNPVKIEHLIPTICGRVGLDGKIRPCP